MAEEIKAFAEHLKPYPFIVLIIMSIEWVSLIKQAKQFSAPVSCKMDKNLFIFSSFSSS